VRKGPDYDNGKPSISLDICDQDTPKWFTKSWWGQQNFRSGDFNLTTRNPWFINFLVDSNPLSSHQTRSYSTGSRCK